MVISLVYINRNHLLIDVHFLLIVYAILLVSF